MDWMRRQDVKESQEAPGPLTPEDDDECYFEEEALMDEGMVREILPRNFARVLVKFCFANFVALFIF